MQRSATPDPVLRDDNVHLSLPRGPTWFPQSGAGTPFASLPRWFGRAEPAAASAPLDAHLNPAVLSAMALDHNPGIPPAPSPSPTGALPLYEDHWDPEFTYPGAASAPPNYSTLSSTQSERTATIDAPRYDTQSLSRRLDAASHGAYKVGRKIGEGTLAVVREAVNIETGQSFALKILPIENIRGREHRVKSEIDVLRRISRGHPNVIHLYDSFTDHKNLFLVMDFCAGGELYERIYRFGPYPEDTAGGIIRVVVTAVKYLHDNGVVHRDLKAENILFRGPDTNDPNNIVIADFGLARLFQNNETSPLKTVCGTPGWMAPEVLTAKSIYGREVDLWAIGVLAYFILSGLMPFESDNHLEETINVTVGRYQFGHGFEHVSAIAKNFIKMLLIVTPVLRMTSEQALRHPFLNAAEAQRLQRHYLDLQLKQQQEAILQSTSLSPVSASSPDASVAELLNQLHLLQQVNGGSV